MSKHRPRQRPRQRPPAPRPAASDVEQRNESHRFVASLKRRILAGTLVATAAFGGLAASHVVGVTASTPATPTAAPAARANRVPTPTPNDFFGGPQVRSGPGLNSGGGDPYLFSSGS